MPSTTKSLNHLFGCPVASLLLCCLITLGVSCAADTQAAETESYRYLQQSGKTEEHFDWILQQQEEPLLRAIGPVEEHQTLMDSAMATRRWELNIPQSETCVEARREGNSILLRGRWRGKPLDRTLDIDEAPWFQALSVSLRPFLKQPQTSIEFWTLRPDKLTVHKILASKKGREPLLLDGQEVMADKVEITMTGLAAWLGRGRYWFRASDNVLLRYQGPGGLPGVPSTLINLVPDL